jgi:hypothetical protein
MKNLLISLLSICLSVSSVLAQLPSWVPSGGLLVYYPFNGNANDEGGNGVHGTNTGGTLTSDRAGISDKAYALSTSGSKIALFTGHTSYLPSTRSISFWFKTSNTGLEQKVLSYRPSCSGGTERFFEFYTSSTSNSLIYIHSGSGSVGAYYNENEWNHVALTIRNDSAKLYVNDVYQGVVLNVQVLSQTATFGVSSVNACIANFGQNKRFTGSIDEIGVWNRALTAAEITGLAKRCHFSITGHPHDTTLYTGDDAIFTAGANDSSGFLWQANPDSLGWINIPGNSKYSGNTSDTLKISNIDLRNHLQQFRAIALLGTCPDTSEVALLSIGDTCIISVFDTIPVYDTTFVTIYDTVSVFDTTFITIYDTVAVYDTLFVTITDSVTFTDTVTVMDTVYITITDSITITDTSFVTISDTSFITITDTVFVTITDTSLISVTDTLVIKAVLTGVAPPNNINKIKIYPNPASTHIYIDNGDYSRMGGYTIIIKNSLGQTVFNQTVTQQQYYIDLSAWTGKGTYFVYILDDQNNKIELKKIVLQ